MFTMRLRSIRSASSRDRLVSRSPRMRIVAAGPPQQPALGLGRGEPAELGHLIDPDLTALEGCPEPLEGSEGMSRPNPALWLPPGDAVPHGDEVGHAHRTRVDPDTPFVGPGDELEHAPLRAADLRVRPIELLDEFRAGGEGLHGSSIERVFVPVCEAGHTGTEILRERSAPSPGCAGAIPRRRRGCPASAPRPRYSRLPRPRRCSSISSASVSE